MLSHVQFRTKIASAVWMQDQKQWQLEILDLTSNTTHLAYYDIIFSAVGTLRVPNIPSLYNKFTGPLMHTGHWDASIDLKGKRVALVGSGARFVHSTCSSIAKFNTDINVNSAVQVIPHLALESSQLISFQRTAPWVVPQILSTISEGTKRTFSNYPVVLFMYRCVLFILVSTVRQL